MYWGWSLHKQIGPLRRAYFFAVSNNDIIVLSWVQDTLRRLCMVHIIYLPNITNNHKSLKQSLKRFLSIYLSILVLVSWLTLSNPPPRSPIKLSGCRIKAVQTFLSNPIFGGAYPKNIPILPIYKTLRNLNLFPWLSNIILFYLILLRNS